jgi:hypothetical protein
MVTNSLLENFPAPEVTDRPLETGNRDGDRDPRRDATTTDGTYLRRVSTTTNDHQARQEETTTNDHERHHRLTQRGRTTTAADRRRRDDKYDDADNVKGGDNDEEEGRGRRETTTARKRKRVTRFRTTTEIMADRRRTPAIGEETREREGYYQFFESNDVDCSDGEQDDETMVWSNVVYAEEREYVRHAAGFEPESEYDCFLSCERNPGCNFFWYEKSLPDDELTETGRYCILHKECVDTRTPGWKGTAFALE